MHGTGTDPATPTGAEAAFEHDLADLTDRHAEGVEFVSLSDQRVGGWVNLQQGLAVLVRVAIPQGSLMHGLALFALLLHGQLSLG